MKKQIAAFASIGVVAFLSGCTSQAVKGAISDLNNSHLAYGSVTKIFPGDSEGNITNCAKFANPAWAKFCAAPAKFVEAKVAILNSSRFVTATVAAPIEWDVQVGSILQFDPKSSGIATSLAAKQPTEGCKWTGYDLDSLNSRTGMLKGFVAGMSIIPGAIMLADDSLTEGGVECNGWSYKELLNPNKNT